MSAIGDNWLKVLIDSLSSEQRSPYGDLLPRFPSEEMQRNTTGLSAEAALRQAYAFYENVTDALTRAGITLDSESKVLDFGFGWGRISRVFMKDLPLQAIHGIDVDPEFAKLTRMLFSSDQFNMCRPFPPAPYPDATFDLIYAYSVFSHLSEDACQRWMAEFGRMLKPGGVVAFTTRHESFFDFCEWAAKQHSESDYIRALGNLFPDLDDAKARYKDGHLVHASSSGVAGGGVRNASFYGETWIPKKYVITNLSQDLVLIADYFDGTRYDQICFALQKRQ